MGREIAIDCMLENSSMFHSFSPERNSVNLSRGFPSVETMDNPNLTRLKIEHLTLQDVL